LAEEPPKESTSVWGLFTLGIFRAAGRIFATDGSGGVRSSDARLRRCGYGIVAADADTLQVLGTMWGTTSTAKQTVPRSELEAVTQLMRRTTGDLKVLVDAKYVIDGFHKGPKAAHPINGEAWRAFWAAADERQGEVQLRKVKSHTGQGELDAQVIEPWQQYLNGLADKLADLAANSHAVSDHLADFVQATDKGAAAVLSRLVEVARMRVHASKQGELAANQLQLREAAKARRAELRQVRIVAKARELGHEVNVTEEGDITCNKCGKCAKAGSRTSALGSMCAEGFPPDLHVTHRPHYRCIEGIHVCCKCGKLTRKRWLGLRKPCAPPTAGGRAVLRRLEKGLAPMAT